MKIRKILLVALCFTMIFTLTGCFSKTAINTSKFIGISKDSGFTLVDVIDQYEEYEVVKEATVAKGDGDYQVEFFVLTNENEAKGMFETNQKTFKSYKKGTSTESSVNMGNYSTYTLNSNGYYMHLCRVDNTLIYVRVLDEYKDKVTKLVDKLGY